MHIMFAGPYHVVLQGEAPGVDPLTFTWGSCDGCYPESSQRTLFGNLALVLINHSFSLNYRCCLFASGRGAFLQSSVCIVKLCRNWSFSCLGRAVLIVEQMQKCWWRSTARAVSRPCAAERRSRWLCVAGHGVRSPHPHWCAAGARALRNAEWLRSCTQVSKSQGLRAEVQHKWLEENCAGHSKHFSVCSRQLISLKMLTMLIFR